jgi:hypothetical protein
MRFGKKIGNGRVRAETQEEKHGDNVSQCAAVILENTIISMFFFPLKAAPATPIHGLIDRQIDKL